MSQRGLLTAGRIARTLVLIMADLKSVTRAVDAVEALSSRVGEGGSLAIVGESGSRKITTMIVWLESPTAGTIATCGRDRSHSARTTKDRRRGGRAVQIVFQGPYGSLDPRQTVAATLDEALRLHRDLPRNQRRDQIRAPAELLGLDDRQTAALPRTLSGGGQRQRIAVARLLASEPRILVQDASVAALDVPIQAEILNLLADIREATCATYMVISHFLPVVRHSTDEAIVMYRGSVVKKRSHRADPRQPSPRLHPAAPRQCPQARVEADPPASAVGQRPTGQPMSISAQRAPPLTTADG